MITNFSPVQKPSFGATPNQIKKAMRYIVKNPTSRAVNHNALNPIIELRIKGLTDEFAEKASKALPKARLDKNPSALARKLCNTLLNWKGLESLGYKVKPYNPNHSSDIMEITGKLNPGEITKVID